MKHHDSEATGEGDNRHAEQKSVLALNGKA